MCACLLQRAAERVFAYADARICQQISELPVQRSHWGHISLVKSSAVIWATNETHAVGFAGTGSETRNDRLGMSKSKELSVLQAPDFLNRSYCLISMKIRCRSEKWPLCLHLAHLKWRHSLTYLWLRVAGQKSSPELSSQGSVLPGCVAGQPWPYST